jgi:hypothetical protein
MQQKLQITEGVLLSLTVPSAEPSVQMGSIGARHSIVSRRHSDISRSDHQDRIGFAVV